MKCDTPMSLVVLVTFLEVPIHIRIYQSEDNGLVTYQSLVMTLAVRDGLLILAPILNLPEDAAWLPCLVWQLLDGLDLEIWDVHGHTIIEAITSVLELGS